MSKDRGTAKKQGQSAAKAWLLSATTQQKINLAGCRFDYGDTLIALASNGLDVPLIADVDSSWGFFKQVKGHVHAGQSRARGR